MRYKSLFLVSSMITLSVMLMLSSGLLTGCSKKELIAPTPPVIDTTKGFDQPDKFIVISVWGKEKNLGLLINDPVGHMQYAAFGSKDGKGELDSIRFIVETDPKTGGWLSHELNEDYTPKSTNTSTGQTLEYEDFDPVTKTGSITIKETSTGKIIHSTGKKPISDDVWQHVKRMQELNKKRGPFPPGWQGELIYVATAGFGCAMGIAGLSMGNPLALGWGIYNTYQNCKSFVEAANNILNGQPAFGCITAADNANALSGFAETISQGGGIGALATGLIPAVMNYVAQDGVAGQCQPENDPPQDPLGSGGGWGDPHLFTPDGMLYDFHGYGEFIALKSTVDNFEVQVRQGTLPYSLSTHATVNTGIAVQTGDDIVCIISNRPKLYINNIEHDWNFDNIPLKAEASIKKINEGIHPVIVITNKNGDQVRVRLDASYISSYFDYTVKVSQNRAGKVTGLLGNADGNKNNDLRIANGAYIENVFEQLYPVFADSWRIKQAASLFHYEQGKTTDSHTKKDFPSSPAEITEAKRLWAENICKAAGVSGEPGLSNCTFDVAVTSDPEMAATSLWGMQNWTPSNQPFDFNNIVMQGNAAIVDARIRLTESKVYLSGQAFHKQPLTGNFETKFSFRLPYSANGGADGMALLIAKEIPTHINNSYPGSAGKLGYQGVPSSLAVEFDTWTDAGENSNHIAVHTKGTEPNSTHYSAAVASNNNIPEMQGGAVHKAKINYKNGKISVWLDDALVLEHTVDLFSKLGLSDKFYIGITASTSSSFQEHNILEWSVKNL